MKVGWRKLRERRGFRRCGSPWRPYIRKGLGEDEISRHGFYRANAFTMLVSNSVIDEPEPLPDVGSINEHFWFIIQLTTNLNTVTITWRLSHNPHTFV